MTTSHLSSIDCGETVDKEPEVGVETILYSQKRQMGKIYKVAANNL